MTPSTHASSAPAMGTDGSVAVPPTIRRLDAVQLQTVIDAFEDPAALIGPDAELVVVNRAWRAHGFSDPVLADGDPTPVTRVIAREIDHHAAIGRRHRNDGWRWFRSRVRAITDMEGIVAIITHRDITEERRFRMRMARSPIAHLELEPDGSLLSVNERWEEMRGRPVGAELGHRWLRDTPSDEREDLVAQLALAEPFEFLLTTAGADDRIRVIELDLEPVFDDDEWIGWHASATDRTEIRELEAVASNAFVDPLTGVANRAMFETTLERMLARREHESVGVLFIDLDGFKAVNDEHGHATGDDVLRTVAGRLTNALRPSDLIARYGGDEFAVVLEDVEAPFAAEVGGRLVAAFVDPIEHGGGFSRVGVSIGVAMSWPDDDVDAIVHRADQAMYRAKEAGGMRIETAPPASG
jgi:diguanylate cyclase (GGDEF)-like protein